MGAYFIKCLRAIRDELSGEIWEIHCTYDPETKSGSGFNKRKPEGTIHWVSASHGIKVDIHEYNRLLLNDDDIKETSKTWEEKLNPQSLVIYADSVIEPSLASAVKEEKFQFVRNGYYCVDSKYTSSEKLVFNRIVSLKNTWK